MEIIFLLFQFLQNRRLFLFEVLWVKIISTRSETAGLSNTTPSIYFFASFQQLLLHLPSIHDEYCDQEHALIPYWKWRKDGKNSMSDRSATGNTGRSLSLTDRKWMGLIFYMQLSNLITTSSALLLLIFGQPYFVTVLRYLSTCMLVMTFFVTTCVLIPMGGNPGKLLWSGNGLYHHVLFPVISTASHILAENHAGLL